MIPKAEAYEFIDSNVAILANSGINIYVPSIKKSVDKGRFTKKYFLSLIRNEIFDFISDWFRNPSTRNAIDIDLLILDVKRSGKLFKYTYLKDTEPFRSLKLVSLEEGISGLIVSFSNGDLYRMQIICGYRIIFSKIDSLPQTYDASELKDLILQILKPILEFKHEDDDMTQFMKNEFLKYIPFEDHTWITNEEYRIITNWEYHISNGLKSLSRDRVRVILNMFLPALKKYSNDWGAPSGWNELVNSAMESLKSF